MSRPERGFKRRPPWWPEDEQWPPAEWSGHSRGRWRRRAGPPLVMRIGCALIVFALLAGLAVNVLIWLVAALFGSVAAPPSGLAILIALLVVAFVAASIALRGVQRLSAPLDDLSDAAERIERGDYSVRVPVSGPARMRSLATAFNDMSARLAAVDEGRRAFLADAAHELRTPLSIISGQLEAIEEGIYPADSEHLAPIHDQIRALEKLIDDMRTVALAEAGGLTLDRQPTDLVALAEELVAAFQAQAQTVGVELGVRSTAGLPRVAADSARIRQVLSNLLSNAIRHTPSGGLVTVSLGLAEQPRRSIAVEVADTGLGIAPELLPTIFDRFVKEPDSTGSGLGLAIARDLVEAHGGTISARSEPGSGTTMTITLPTAT